VTDADAAVAASLMWGLPFVGLLASIALAPVAAPRLWSRHSGKIAALWSVLAAAPLAQTLGPAAAGSLLFKLLATQYLPFALTLFATYTAAGGVTLRGRFVGGPLFNTLLLAVGSGLASLMGTTGAALLLIRPLLRANAGRKHKTHCVVFFIFLVANIGGALSPLGDPPLFVGYLQGVDFFWPLRRLWPATATCVGLVLLVFYGLDRVLASREKFEPRETDETPPRAARFEILGGVNLLLAAATAAAVAVAGHWRSAISFELAGATFGLQDIFLDVALVVIAFASLALTDRASRAANGFEWEPLREVVELFLAIFICVEPIIVMLELGSLGPLAPLFDLVSKLSRAQAPHFYFWASGLLSSFLDSAPTYLVFFQLAGGDPTQLTGPDAARLVALSLGSVFMGALTYIGNAPNAIVLSIARRAGTPMPGFVGYLAWSLGVLGPIFIIVDLLFVG
jgi:Na+/H+ antiporter NhaD/arsenite permease-like protein